MIAAGECATNALQHGASEQGDAFVQVSIDFAQGLVQVRVTDYGKGIALDELPRKALMHRHCGTETPKDGFYLMLTTCDRVWMVTGANGTTIVLEQRIAEPDTALTAAAKGYPGTRSAD